MIDLARLERLARRARIALGPKAARAWSGRRRTGRRGHGLTFAGHREYQFGDDVRWMDWRATARLARPVVKVFEQEQAGTVLVLLDASGSMTASASDPSHLDPREVAALLVLVALEAHERVGLLLFTDRIERVILPRRGRAHARRVIAALGSHRPSSRRTAIGPGLDGAGRLARRVWNILIVSDFLDCGYDASLDRLRRRHDVSAFCCGTSAVWPEASGLVRGRDPESGRLRWFDTESAAVAAAVAARRAKFAAERRQIFEKANVPLYELGGERSAIHALIGSGSRHVSAFR